LNGFDQDRFEVQVLQLLRIFQRSQEIYKFLIFLEEFIEEIIGPGEVVAVDEIQFKIGNQFDETVEITLIFMEVLKFHRDLFVEFFV
jgi:hypothetical protein